MFWTFGNGCPGFQSQGGSFACVSSRRCAIDFLDSLRVQHLLTSWRRALQLNLLNHLYSIYISKHWWGSNPGSCVRNSVGSHRPIRLGFDMYWFLDKIPILDIGFHRSEIQLFDIIYSKINTKREECISWTLLCFCVFVVICRKRMIKLMIKGGRHKPLSIFRTGAHFVL